MQQNEKNDERIHSIDILKAVCVLFVVITHYQWEDSQRLLYLFPFWIKMAVPNFMIISGYVYTKSFIKRNINDLESAYTFNNIIDKIIKYIFPFLFAFAITEAACVYTGRHSGVWAVIQSFLCGGYGRGSYYVPLMIQFIFVFPVIYIIIKKFDFKGLLICGVLNFLFELFKEAFSMNEECYRLLLFRYILVIAYGCYLAMGNYKRHIALSIISFCLGAAYIAAFSYFGIIPPITSMWTGTSMWACLFIIPIIKPLMINKAKFKPLELIGKASYDIFLVQMVFYNFVKYVYKMVKNPWLQLLACIVICVTAGILFYLFESFITKKIIKKIKRK